MGFSLEWIAVKHGTRDSVLSALNLRGTGQREQIPESDLAGTSLPAGWYMVVSNHGNPALMVDKTLARVSASSDVVACFVEEHVMCSCAQGWRDGRRVWLVMHEAGTGGIDHLEVKGNLPKPFNEVKDRQCSKQKAAGGSKAGVDHIFDIPVDLAQTVTGYRHDRDIPGAGDEPFEVLETTDAAPKRSWFRRILGA